MATYVTRNQDLGSWCLFLEPYIYTSVEPPRNQLEWAINWLDFIGQAYLEITLEPKRTQNLGVFINEIKQIKF